MTGALEQKLDLIQWIMSGDDVGTRYGVLRRSTPLSSNSKVVSEIYRNFLCLLEKQHKLDSDEFCRYEKKLFCNRDFFWEAYEKIRELFKDSYVVVHFCRSFQNFLSIKEFRMYELEKKLNSKSDCLSEEDKKRMGKEYDGLKKLLEKSSLDVFLNDRYDETINFRHSVAHNINSIIEDIPSISQMNDSKFIFQNYFVRFSVLLFVDLIFTDMFCSYETFCNKYIL